MKESSPIKSYEMNSLSPNEWDAFVKKMNTNYHYFDEYYSNYHRFSDAWPRICRNSCMQKVLNSVNVTNPF